LGCLTRNSAGCYASVALHQIQEHNDTFSQHSSGESMISTSIGHRNMEEKSNISKRIDIGEHIQEKKKRL
jgi:hypothetical protein